MVCRTATFGVARLLRFWNYTTFARCGSFVRACVKGHFPASISYLFPYSHVPSCDADGLPVLVPGVPLVVPPRKSHVVGWSHLRALRDPRQLVLPRIPLSFRGYRCPTYDGGLSIVQNDGVVCEPAGEGFAASFCNSLGKLSFQFHEDRKSTRLNSSHVD